MKRCALFLDTNIYLHYTFFAEIPWEKIVEAEEVFLVVPPIVLSEIDKHKYSHSSSRIRERAAKVARKYAELIDGDEHLRPGVRIVFQAVEPTDFESHQLVRESQDDRLLASILGYMKENPTSEIILVTSDIGLKVKSKTRNIRTLSLPDDSRMIWEDANEKRSRISNRNSAHSST